MRILKSLLAGFILLMCCGWVGPWDEWDTMSGPGIETSTLGQLQAIGGLTFYKDYTIDNSLDADYSVGDGTATFTRDNVACTYIDSSGVVQTVSTANVPRFYSKEYSATGTLDANGLIIEASKTNRATYSGTPENAAWTKTNITADNDDAGSTSPDGTVTANSLTASANNGTFVQAYPITGDPATYTASVWLKRKTGTGVVDLGAVEDGTGKTAVTVTSSWTRFSVAATTDGDDAGKDPAFYLELETDTDAVYIYGPQLEAGPYMTSYIPVALGTAATRGAEVLKYPISGNRTAAQETIVIKFMPLGGSFANDNVYRFLTDTDTKNRYFRKANTGTVLTFRPNNSDSSGCSVTQTTTPLVNTSYVVAGLCSHTSPYAESYLNGAANGTDETADDFTNPAWGTNFYVGSDKDSVNQPNSLIQKVAFFNRPLSATEVLAVYNLM